MRAAIAFLFFFFAAIAWADEAVPPPIARVWKQRPRDPSVLYQVAASYARAGRGGEALDLLERMERTGAGLVPRARDGFAPLEGHPRYVALRARLAEAHPPVRRAALAFEVAEADLVAEGIAWSGRTRELYMGSIKRKIIAIAGDGRARDLVPAGRDGLGVVLGLRVDDARGELWAVSEIMEPTPGVVVGVFRFRLPDGALWARTPSPTAWRTV